MESQNNVYDGKQILLCVCGGEEIHSKALSADKASILN